MAQPWSQVEQSPQFQQLPPEEQWKARNEYFDEVVAPKVPKEQLDAVKQQFIKDTNPVMHRQSLPTPQEKEPEKFGGINSAVDEPMLHFASSAVATPVSGLAGLVSAPFVGTDKAADIVEKVGSALTYEPKTTVGKAVTSVPEYPFKKLGQFGDYAGEKTAEASGSPALGAGVNTAIQALPAVLMRKGGVKESVKVNPEQVAKDYVNKSTNINWDSVPAKVKKTLTDVAAKSGNLDGLDPKAVERVARAQSQGIPITRGQATRDLAQITKEENIRRTEAGEPIRKISAQQDTALHKRLQEVGTEVAPGSSIKSSSDVGTPLQNAARRKLQVMKGQASREYRKAEQSGEVEKPVDTAPLHQWLENSLNKANTPQLQSILSEYEKKGPVTIRQLEDIRQDLNAERKTPSKAAHYAGEAIKVVDQILDNSGGDLYKKARTAYKAWNDEFTRQAAVRDLVSDKANLYDRKIALENTLDHVIRGSGEQLTDIKKTLTEGGTEATRKRGAKAWRDVQAGAIAYLREKAAGKREITGTEGQLQFNSSFLDAVADMEKGGKLDILFGKKAADQIRKLAETTRDVRTTPDDRISGPNTASRLASIAETFLHIPGIKQVAEHVKTKSDVNKAINQPLPEPSKPTVKDLQF